MIIYGCKMEAIEKIRGSLKFEKEVIGLSLGEC